MNMILQLLQERTTCRGFLIVWPTPPERVNPSRLARWRRWFMAPVYLSQRRVFLPVRFQQLQKLGDVGRYDLAVHPFIRLRMFARS